MKIIYTFLIAILFTGTINAATKTWTGASGGTWSTGTNWSGGVPAANDDVVFNLISDLVVDVTAMTNLTSPAGYNSLSINGAGFILTFLNTTTTGKSIVTNAGASGGVIVGSNVSVIFKGSTLNADGSYSNGNVKLSINGGTNTINGKLFFMGVSSQLLVGSNVAATPIIFKDTLAIFSGTGGAANPSWPSGFGFINPTFDANSLYYIGRNGGVLPAATYNTSSTIVLAGNRKFDYTTIAETTSVPTIAGSSPYTYGKLIWDRPLQGSNVTLFSGASNIYNATSLDIKNTNGFNFRVTANTAAITNAVTLTSDLNVRSSGKVSISNINTVGATPTVNVGGNLVIESGGQLDLQENGTGVNTTVNVVGAVNIAGTLTETGGSTGSIVKLNGSSAQNVSIATLTNDVSLTFNNAAGFNLLSNITMPNNTNAKLNLTNGIINSTGFTVSHPFALQAAITGGLSTCFINGGTLSRGISAATGA